MYRDNPDSFNSSANRNGLPNLRIAEAIIRETIRLKYGAAYEELILDGWTVVSIDTANLIMRTNSPFRCEVIRSRLLADMEQVISDVYGIHPVILITSDQ